MASENGHKEVVEILLQYKADRNIRTNDKHYIEKYRNKTASEIAKIANYSEILSLIGKIFIFK